METSESVVVVWTDGYNPSRSMPPLIRRKAYYIKGIVEMIPRPNEVVLIRLPRWFAQEHRLRIIDYERDPEYDI